MYYIVGIRNHGWLAQATLDPVTGVNVVLREDASHAFRFDSKHAADGIANKLFGDTALSVEIFMINENPVVIPNGRL